MKYTSVFCGICNKPILGIATLTNFGWIHKDCDTVGVAFR
jgi:hypothetical protein